MARPSVTAIATKAAKEDEESVPQGEYFPAGPKPCLGVKSLQTVGAEDNTDARGSNATSLEDTVANLHLSGSDKATNAGTLSTVLRSTNGNGHNSSVQNSTEAGMHSGPVFNRSLSNFDTGLFDGLFREEDEEQMMN